MRQLLSQGVPFVVNNIQLQGNFDPDYFINKHHGRPCNIHFVNTGKVEQTTVENFFRTFGDLRAPEARAKLKASLSSHFAFLRIILQQDWPSEEHFRTESWELFMAFIDAVPFPDTMNLNGARNLAAHFPTNALPPDLGMSR